MGPGEPDDHSQHFWWPDSYGVAEHGPDLHPLRVVDGAMITEDHWNPGGLVDRAMNQYREINHYLADTQQPGPEPGKDAARWTPALLKEDDHDGNV